MQAADSKTVESPCSGVCQLGPDGLCLGCYRSRDEIARWLRMPAQERRHLMQVLLPARAALPPGKARP